MRILKRGLGLLLVVVLVAVVAAAGFLTWVTVRAMPETTGTIAATGLGAPVTVARDAAGIAHITADTPHDLFFAQGYVHASERMWQMEVWRHISAGRLAEVFGASQLDTDQFIRTLGWRVAAQRDLDAVVAARPGRPRCVYAGRQRVAGRASRVARAGVPRRRASRPSRGRTSTRSRGARSRRGTSAATSTPRCSGTWPTGSWATRPGRMSSSPPTATALRSSPRPACPARAAPGTRARRHRRARVRRGRRRPPATCRPSAARTRRPPRPR